MSENNYELNDVEMRILQLLAKGITSYDKIGSEIFFGRRVVGRRLNDIGKKLGASGQVNILRQALLKDILTIDDLKGGEKLMPDFTKGKWIYDAKTGLISSDGYTIISVCYPETKEAQSIGWLIESAPDMYGLLKECMKKIHSFDDTHRRIEALLNKIDGGNNHEE